MDGAEGSWRFLYDSDSDDELLRFAEGYTAVPAERHRQRQQQVLAAHDDAQPAYAQMMADLPSASASAMQLDHHQARPMVHVQQPQPAPPMPVEHQQEPSMVHLQYPQPATAMPFEPQEAPSMVHLQFPQPAPAMPLQHQPMPGESRATVLLHHGQDQHLMGESSSAMPLHHLQMLGDSPATMQLQHQQMHGLSEPTPEEMSTHEYEQIMANLGLTELYVEGEELHLPGGGGGGAASIPDPEPPVAKQGLQDDQIPKPSQQGGEGHFFAAAPQPGDDLGPSGAGSIPGPEPPVTPPVVAPAQPEHESCEHCYVVREVRNHNALGLVTFSAHRAADGSYTHAILELKGTAAQGPNSGTQRIYKCLRDLTPESAPKYVESCIRKMRDKTGPLEDVVGGAAASSSMIRAPPGDPGSPWAPEGGMRRTAPPSPPPPRRPTEQEERETRQYLRDAADMAGRELGSLASEVRSVRNQRAPDNNRKALFSRLRELNHKIKRFEKDSAKRAGSELSKIRREVDGFVMEKRQLYDALKELMQRVTKNCHRLPPRGNDDQAGGSGAAGAAVL
ncbi:uncharacterized protein LOC123430883 [Hordeum vulgare subsp. vulgare]|uniref:Predicted protein n=1 Tax=Hordeum vulgare subsp. vulgare TaxID=112509 RepID=F2EK84_HORVV|nr:uncharacterized protein LOC123430883 [Hordeum vulgare subsp. vulgare]BAK07756.1 predicted protein [Hordeum vulgare subsp. vulgare]